MRPLSERSPLRRWWVILLIVVLATIAGAAIAAAVVTKATWGFWIIRPGPDPDALNAKSVRSVTNFVLQAMTDGSTVPILGDPYPGPGWYATEKAAYPQEFDYYLLERRLLHQLEEAGALSAPVPSLTTEQLASIWDAHNAQNVLGDDLPAFDGKGRGARGVVYQLADDAGKPLLVIAIRGSEISNDHHPYYESLFRESPGAAPHLISVRHFYFDIAGIEGIEFTAFFVFFAVLGLAVAVPLVCVILLFRRLSKSSKVRRGLCPQCGYDLSGEFGAGCPECGMGRGTQPPIDPSRYGFVQALRAVCQSPPGWPLIIASVLAALFIAWGMSTPGRLLGWISLGLLIGAVAAVVTLIKLASCMLPGGPRGRSIRRAAVRFGLVCCVAALTTAAVQRRPRSSSGSG